jgi:large subunit ribosomal protein L9
MKVILTQDVDTLGLVGQIVDVSSGYARNKLLPGELAVKASASNMRAFEKTRAEFEVRSLKEKERAEQLAQQIGALSLTISQKSGENDKLYGSVTSMDLAQLLSDNKVDIDRRKIRMQEPIKTLGDFEIPVKIHPEVTATFKVSVVKAEEE